jgi:glucose/mannose transport system permease protein
MRTALPERTAPDEAVARPSRRHRRRFHVERIASPLMLAPTLIIVGIFVYVFILLTGYISVSNWSSQKIDLSVSNPLFQTYGDMVGMPSFQASFRNTVLFTLFFLILAVGGGLGLAILLHRSFATRKEVRGRTVFRSLFMFPYALSFVVTGVVWRWLFNPETGVNVLFDIFGINRVLDAVGVGPIKPGWLTDPTVVGSVNGAIATVFPDAAKLQTQFGIPLALIPVVIAAAWQLSGFAMTMYLAGLAAIPDDVVEAAAVDGATASQTYRRVVIPMLTPVTISILVILGYTSLKIFDLVYVMSGVGPGFATSVMGIFVFEQTFKAGHYNLGAAASIVMLVMVSLLVVPYLVRNMRNLS